MHFRSSPILLVLCAITLMALIAFRFTVPRLWGTTYVQDQEREQEGASGDALVIAGEMPTTATVQIGQPLRIENRIPRSIRVTFMLTSEDDGAYTTSPLMIGSSSQATLQFATSGAWKCQSDIIHACGTVHVTASEAY